MENSSAATTAPSDTPRVLTQSAPPAPLPRAFWAALAGLCVVFSWPLIELARFSLGSHLYSHLVLIPFASAYFIWIKRGSLPPAAAPDRAMTMLFGLLGLAFSLGYVLTATGQWSIARTDVQVLTALAVSSLLVAICAFFLGRPMLKALSFPLGFMIFFSPIPTAALGMIETFLQHGSALAAYGFFQLSSTPLYRDGLLFILPGFSMQVAPQCSGIHSSLALFITSVAGGYLFLRSRTKRIILAAAVIPLALLRNGFRVFVIGELCVRISPDMIDSWVHKQGGPFFFALSLIPFSILLYFLYRADRRSAA